MSQQTCLYHVVGKQLSTCFFKGRRQALPQQDWVCLDRICGRPSSSNMGLDDMGLAAAIMNYSFPSETYTDFPQHLGYTDTTSSENSFRFLRNCNLQTLSIVKTGNAACRGNPLCICWKGWQSRNKVFGAVRPRVGKSEVPVSASGRSLGYFGGHLLWHHWKLTPLLCKMSSIVL